MTIRFEMRESRSHRLWDHGWFDVTHFDVLASLPTDDAAGILRAFFKDPLSDRSFCRLPDPWGAGWELHGPFVLGAFDAGWFQRISARELRAWIDRLLGSDEFTERPSGEQVAPIDEWLKAVEDTADAVFRLEAPDQPGVRVDWDHVWILFEEAVIVSADRTQLTVAVLGYD